MIKYAFSGLNKDMEIYDAFLTLAILSSMHNYRLFNLQQDADVPIKCKTLSCLGGVNKIGALIENVIMK